MVTIMVLTRILTKQDFGLLSFVLLAYSTVTTLSQLGLSDSVFYFFERIAQEGRKSFALLTGKTLFLIGLGGSAIFIALTFIAPRWGFQVEDLFFPLIGLALLELPTLPLPNILIAINRVKKAAALSIFCSFLQFTAIILPAALGYSLRVIVFSLLGYGVVRFILSALLFFTSFPEKGRALPKGMMRQQFRYSLPLGIAQILWGLNRQIDKYIVAAFFPVIVLAEYNVGAWEIPFIPTIAYSVGAVLMPQLVSLYLRKEKKELLSLWNQAICKVAIIVLPLTILFFLVAEDFIAVVFSENYLAAATPFRIYTLILLYRVASYSSMHKALGTTRIITSAAIYLVVINLTLSIPFVFIFGIAGPPLATLLANMFAWGYWLDKMKKKLAVPINRVFPIAFYLRSLLTSVISAVPVWILQQNLSASYGARLTVVVFAYILSYALVSKVTGVVKKEDWGFLMRGLKAEKK
jgi:O-antigen/teichoic acid export membrane protein